jgi:phosphatidylglycerol:prolipoprotein diacylglycerol transferase
MVDQSYLHQLDPFAIQITETFGLRWYGLAYIAGFLVAWASIRWMGKKKITEIQPSQVGDFMFAAIIGVLVGGRLGYCFFYQPSLLYTFTDSFPWWKLLAIQDGGMASHGGIVGVAFAFVIWGKRNNVSILHLFDIGAMFATPGLFFGRIANFINGELWGRPLPQNLQSQPPAWSVKYPTEITDVWVLQPEKFTEKLSLLEPLQTSVAGGTSFHQTIVHEMYAGNAVVIETVQPLLTAWYPSQLFQAVAEGPLLFFAFLILWWKPRKPGTIACSFLLLYGVARVATEAFRQPDEGVAIILGLSRGQVLSVGMIALGLVLLVMITRLKSKTYGGFQAALRP